MRKYLDKIETLLTQSSGIEYELEFEDAMNEAIAEMEKDNVGITVHFDMEGLWCLQKKGERINHCRIFLAL